MLVRLTKATRQKAGRLVALVYLLCVLAPSVSFAFAEVTGMQCIPGSEHNKEVHDHSHASSHAEPHAHVDSAKSLQTDIHNIAATEALKSQADGEEADRHHPGGKCCSLMCLIALPAALAEFVSPPPPVSLRISSTYELVASNLPSRLYRPPIS